MTRSRQRKVINEIFLPDDKATDTSQQQETTTPPSESISTRTQPSTKQTNPIPNTAQAARTTNQPINDDMNTKTNDGEEDKDYNMQGVIDDEYDDEDSSD